MKKRVICLILTAVLWVSVLPLSVFAYAHSSTVPLPDGAYKLWKQYDERWTDVILGVDPWYDSSGAYHKYETMGHAGCLISSMAILTHAYGLTLADGTAIDPGSLGTAMYDGGSCKYLNSRGASKYSTAFNTLIPGVSFVRYQTSSSPVSDIAALLSDKETEYAVMLGVNGGSHYVAVDYVADGEVYICDPGYPKTKLSEYTFSFMLIYKIDEAYADSGTVSPAKPTWVVETSAGVRVRNGAGLSYERVSAYPAGTEIVVLETVEADGYLWGRTALGWSALRTLDGSEVYCVCTSSEQYSVTYHAAGGTGAPEMHYKTAGETLTLRSEKPVKEGCVFLGWSPDPSAVSADYVAGGTYNKEAALELYAVWMQESDIFGHGIDVSAYQGTVDWETVAASGIDFVILRAGTTRGKDTMFETNYLGAKAAGLHVGSYFFSYALTSEEMQADAALFLEWIDGKSFDMPVYLDVETADQKKLPEGVLSTLAAEFLAIMTEHGYYCGVYSSQKWYENYLDEELLGGRERLWVAKWTASGTLSQNMSADYGMYQYSSSGTVAGISGAVDLNVCYTDYPSMLAEIDPPGSGGDDPGESGEVPPVKDPVPTETSGLRIAEDILYGGRIGMTVSEWQTLFDGAVVFVGTDGEPLAEDAIVHTGVSVLCGTHRYTVAVRGDLDGNGAVDLRDYVMTKRYILGTLELEKAAYYAACLEGAELTVRDYMMLKRHVIGTLDIYA